MTQQASGASNSDFLSHTDSSLRIRSFKVSSPIEIQYHLDKERPPYYRKPNATRTRRRNLSARNSSRSKKKKAEDTKKKKRGRWTLPEVAETRSPSDRYNEAHRLTERGRGTERARQREGRQEERVLTADEEGTREKKREGLCCRGNATRDRVTWTNWRGAGEVGARPAGQRTARNTDTTLLRDCKVAVATQNRAPATLRPFPRCLGPDRGVLRPRETRRTREPRRRPFIAPPEKGTNSIGRRGGGVGRRNALLQEARHASPSDDIDTSKHRYPLALPHPSRAVCPLRSRAVLGGRRAHVRTRLAARASRGRRTNHGGVIGHI